jgi:predicted extracellular nuclease
VLVFGRVHVAPQLVRRLPELLRQLPPRAVIGRLRLLEPCCHASRVALISLIGSHVLKAQLDGSTKGEPAAVGTDAANSLRPQESHARPRLAGRIVATDGVVTAIIGNGFYLQELEGDADPATSDGVFVRRKSPSDIRTGSGVEVEGRVDEASSRLGAPPRASLPSPEIDGAIVRRVGSGEVPAPVVIGAGGRLPPTEVIDDDGLAAFDPAADGLDFWESLEGMLVRVDDAVVVGPTNRFRETWVVGNGGRGVTGFNKDGGITVAPGDFNPERIKLPAVGQVIGDAEFRLTIGDRIEHVTGVVSYAFGNYEVVLTEAGPVTAAARPPIRTRLTKAAERLLVGSYNVENLDPKVETAELVADPKSDIDDDVGSGRFAAIARQVVDAMGGPTFWRYTRSRTTTAWR